MTNTPPTMTMTDEQAYDHAVRPQDDFFRHVNGTWLREHEIPADRARHGSFHALHDQAERDVRAIIEEAQSGALEGEAGPETALIGALYGSFMDTARIEELGLAALEPDLALIARADDHHGLARSLGELQRVGVDGAVGLWVDNDADDPEIYRVYLQQSGLGLPDEAYYRLDEHAETRAAYREHVAAQLAGAGIVGVDAADEAAMTVFALETRLAASHWDKVAGRDAVRAYNPTPWASLAESAPGFDWQGWAEGLGASPEAVATVVVRQPSYVRAFAQEWLATPLEDWRLWLAWRVVRSRAPYLGKAIVAENFDFYGRTLTGAQTLRERWKRGVSLVEDSLGEAVGKVYVQRHFPPEHKARMDELVTHLIEAYRRSIAELDWMSQATKERALAKLDAFRPKVGYPSKWRDYSALALDGANLLANVRAVCAHESARELAKIGQPVDREEWLMPPQMVNAYYNPGMNEIVFPAAILQPPFFDAGADDAWNYGGIGAVIGHEIGHGFDDQGSRYDGTGRLVDWWEAADREEFDKRAAALIAQFGAFSPAQLDGSHCVNGALTVGENIGDLGGLTIAIKAYRIAVEEAGGSLDDVVDGLSGLERLFTSWARIWRCKGRDAEVIRLLSIDPHSPEEFRCNGVLSNVDEFAQVYGLGPGDGLWLEEADRVRIW